MTQNMNAYDTRVYGVEAAFQRDFGFIAPSLRCLGFYGNYTYTHSTTRNYNTRPSNVPVCQFQHYRICNSLHLVCNGFIIFKSRRFVKTCMKKFSLPPGGERNARLVPSYRQTQMTDDARAFDKKTLHATRK